MNKFKMTCTCGDVMDMEAATKEEAIEKFKAMMTVDMVAKHFAEKHAGQPVPSVDMVHMNIAQTVVQVM